ncbi:MAG: hypothetical protein CSA82_00275 [Actinobacteria bacterium]|nr:MAG: hypothetical protein CSA82_00275 [Actinomycetota bacterium]
MIAAFTFTDGEYRAHIGPEYNVMLQELLEEILTVLDEPGELSSFIGAVTGIEPDREAPGTPSLDMLLPPMSGDPAEAARLRAVTEDLLRSEKSERIRAVLSVLEALSTRKGDTLKIPEADAWDWLSVLNDIRLVLAGELGIYSDSDAQRVFVTAKAASSSRSDILSSVYTTITWWQDSLVHAMRYPSKDH